uniref:Uncharacterized protein n=1 Tax=Parastrongyloides trichosuri TaxID=131310 RepID=A0A0N4Z047_PARTI
MAIGICTTLQQCNASKVMLYLLMCFFLMILALHLDGSVQLSYFLLFLPLFTFEIFVFMNFLASTSLYFITFPTASEAVFKKDFIFMLLNTIEHTFIALFEIMLYFRLHRLPEATDKNMWLITFSPLLILGFVSVLIMFWSFQNNKSIEAESFYAINFTQTILIACKLNGNINWNWVMVFIPSWILLCVTGIVIIYFITSSCYLCYKNNNQNGLRRDFLYSAVCNTFITTPIFIFLLLLSLKLDNSTLYGVLSLDKVSYRVIFTPLLISLCYLTFCSLGPSGELFWWFSFPKSFWPHCFEVFPCLKLYGNINVRFGTSSASTTPSDGSERRRRNFYQTDVSLLEGECFINNQTEYTDRKKDFAIDMSKYKIDSINNVD